MPIDPEPCGLRAGARLAAFSAIVPRAAACHEVRIDASSPPPPLGAFAGTWAPSRRRQFAAGRACAQEAMARLGMPPSPIGRRADGAPIWPAGVTGSITHTHELAAAVVAPTSRIAAIGIDAEPLSDLEPSLLRYIMTDAEMAPIDRYPDDRKRTYCTTVFSAKEACFKSIRHPSGGTASLREIDIAVNFDECSLSSPNNPNLIGRFHENYGHVFTIFWQPNA